MKILILFVIVILSLDLSAQLLIKESDAFPMKLTSVSIDKDAKTILTGSYDKNIYCLNPETATKTKTIEEHTGFVIATAYSSENNLFATAGWDKRIVIWDAGTMTKKIEIEAHNDRINDLAFSPDGMKLASASDDGTVKVWDMLTGGEIYSIEDHEDAVTSVSYSKDGSMIASGSWDNTAMIHASSDGKLMHTYKGHRNTVSTVDFSFDGSMLATGGEDNVVMIWQTDTILMLAKFDYFRQPITKVLFIPGDKYLFCAEATGDLKVYNVVDKQLLEQNILHEGAIKDMCLNADKDLLITSGADNKIKIWNIAEFKYFDCLKEKIASKKEMTRPKGEFETTEQYEARLKQYGIIKQAFVAECTREAKAREKAEQEKRDKEILATYKYVLLPLEGLGTYNADDKFYPIVFQGSTYNVNMGIEEAKSLKTNVAKAKVKAISRVINGNTEIFNFQLIHPVSGTAFPFGKQITAAEDKYLRQFLSGH